MKIFRTSQIKELDRYTIEHEPISSINLMERAATQIYNWIIERYPVKESFKIFVGPGNNGGDGLAVGRLLAQKGHDITIYFWSSKLSSDSQINYERLQNIAGAKLITLSQEEAFPEIISSDIVIDALFGSGLSRPVEGFPGEIIKHINSSPATVIAIDIPSGLFGEDNSTNTPETIINATYTLTFQFPKLSFFFRENSDYCGAWYVLPIGLHPHKIQETETLFYYVTNKTIKPFIVKRNTFSHKGTFGHALLISGSYGKMGAAVVAAKACLKTGVGLLTCHVPSSGYPIMQTALPEAMTSIDNSDHYFSGHPDLSKFSAIGLGPGLGTNNETQEAFEELMKAANVPLVIDADGLNILAQHKKWLNLIPENTILTPHPKEFDRIAGESKSGYEQNQKQIELAQKYNIFIVLKGAHTAIACPDGSCYYNSTGNPGMATGGTGDALTGIILSLIAQGYSQKEAAISAVYIHGYAGDLAAEQESQEAMIASDLINNLGGVFKLLK